MEPQTDTQPINPNAQNPMPEPLAQPVVQPFGQPVQPVVQPVAAPPRPTVEPVRPAVMAIDTNQQPSTEPFITTDTATTTLRTGFSEPQSAPVAPVVAAPTVFAVPAPVEQMAPQQPQPVMAPVAPIASTQPQTFGTQPIAQPFAPMQQPAFSGQTLATQPTTVPGAPVQSAQMPQPPMPLAPQDQANTLAQSLGVVNDGQIHIGGETGAMAVAAGQFVIPDRTAKKRKMILFGAASAMGMVLLAGLFITFFYIPNTPKGVWRVGMGRTGSEVSAIVAAMDEPKAAAALQKSKLTVDGTLDYNGKVSSLNVNAKYDEKNTDDSVKVHAEIPNTDTIDLTAGIKTQLPENAIFPNVYFNIAGYSKLGLESYMPGINAYDGKWIAVEQDFIKPYQQAAPQTEDIDSTNVTQDEVMSVANDANAVTQEYVFTTDENKSVIELGEFVATEQSEGITANHYKATINKAHLQAYCSAMVDKLAENEAIKKHKVLSGTAKDEAKQDCKEQGKEIKDNQTFDVWFDKKYKLFHKIRFDEDLATKAAANEQKKADCLADANRYEGASSSYCDYYDQMTEKGTAYTDFGQTYKGRDQFVLFVHEKRDTNQDKSDYRADINLNAKTYKWSSEITATSNNDVPVKMHVTIAAEPYSGTIDASKPAGAIPIQQVIEKLTGQPYTPPAPRQTNTQSAKNGLKLPHVDFSKFPIHL